MINSYGWIIYYLDKNKQPLFLIIKRQSLSKKIEWVAPKWKSQKREKQIEAALREIKEETNIDPKYLIYRWVAGEVFLNFENFQKKIKYFLFQYTWDPNSIKIAPWEGFLWIYSWLAIEQVINVVPYSSLREVYRNAYNIIKAKNSNK